MAEKFSHIDDNGNATMVDVGDKPIQSRRATARGIIELNQATIDLIEQNLLKKGDVLTVAKIAGIQAAKKTADLIPLCHPLQLTNIDIQFVMQRGTIQVDSTVSCEGKTGVEMEALTAVSVTLLTIYDMCKAVDKQMKISEIILLNKKKTNI